MQKSIWLGILGIAFAGAASGQIKKQFTVENTTSCETVRLKLKASSGNCFIKPSQNPEILNVFSNLDETAYAHKYRKEIKGKVCDVSLNLEEISTDAFGRSISTKVFGASVTSGEKIWKMYLTDSKPYFLELNYGVGNAHVDLSGLSIKTLKINTGSADVNVGYYGVENQVDMDTFSVKVDLGSVNVKNLNLSRARYMVADVGFGNMMLDFSNQPLIRNTIKGSVGAGNLVIIIDPKTPVLIKIKDSWLCSVKMPKSLKKNENGSYTSTAYSKDSKNALVFDLDVSMGNIVFKEAASK